MSTSSRLDHDRLLAELLAIPKDEPLQSVYQPLDQEQFKSRMNESFPSVYLTLISIIQGVALGILAQNTFGYISTESVSNIEVFRMIPYAILSFLTIVTVSFEYNWFVGIYRWSPKIWDTLIPLLLGMSQIGSLYFLRMPEVWWILNALFAIIGVVAFNNTENNQHRDMFIKNGIYKKTKKEVLIDMTISLTISPILFLVGIYYKVTPIIYFWHTFEIIGFIIYLVGFIYLLYKDEKFVKYMHDAYKLKY